MPPRMSPGAQYAGPAPIPGHGPAPGPSLGLYWPGVEKRRNLKDAKHRRRKSGVRKKDEDAQVSQTELAKDV